MKYLARLISGSKRSNDRLYQKINSINTSTGPYNLKSNCEKCRSGPIKSKHFSALKFFRKLDADEFFAAELTRVTLIHTLIIAGRRSGGFYSQRGLIFNFAQALTIYLNIIKSKGCSTSNPRERRAEKSNEKKTAESKRDYAEEV